MKLNEIGLLAKDPKASKKFYHNVLGLHVDHEEDGLSAFNGGWPGLEIGCSEYLDRVHLSFIVDDVDKFVGPEDIHLEKRAIALTDPDGLRILIQSPTEASPDWVKEIL
jgi:catechol 2,3-dioxygenase-like lactoylglutathione lyase family enzyme